MPKNTYHGNNKKKKKSKKKIGKVKEGDLNGDGTDSPTDCDRKTNHLRQRQSQRNISDKELGQAMLEGERSVSSEDGTVRYSHRGVVFVTSPEGMGITAYRPEPLQCVCGLEDDWDDDFCPIDLNGGRIRGTLDRLSFGIFKAQSRECKKCADRPTDPLAVFLERQKWKAPSMRGVLSHPEFIGYLILAAAGSLLRPVRCDACHGVKGLERSPNPVDESDTLPWLRQLLDLDERWEAGRREKKDGGAGRPLPGLSECKGFHGMQYENPNVAFGFNPLAAAAASGRFRCVVELLQRGSSVDLAMNPIGGPFAGGHVVRLIQAKARDPSSRAFRSKSSCSQYEEILAALSYASGKDGFNLPCEGKGKDLLSGLKSYGMWDGVKRMIDKSNCSILGSMWDGVCHRLILKGGCCDEDDCPFGATFASTVGMTLPPNLPQAGETFSFRYAEPMEDPKVLAFIRRYQSKDCCKSASCPG